VKRFLSLLVIASLLSSCATMSHGTTEVISVDSNPSGADATILCDNKISASGTTPARLTIPRKADGCRITVGQSGMKTQTIAIDRGFASSFWLNFVPASGLAFAPVVAFSDTGSDDLAGALLVAGIAGGVGFVVDRLSGAMYDHNPNVIKVTLQPEQ
jgi:hypothetical protein